MTKAFPHEETERPLTHYQDVLITTIINRLAQLFNHEMPTQYRPVDLREVQIPVILDDAVSISRNSTPSPKSAIFRELYKHVGKPSGVSRSRESSPPFSFDYDYVLTGMMFVLAQRRAVWPDGSM